MHGRLWHVACDACVGPIIATMMAMPPLHPITPLWSSQEIKIEEEFF